MIQRRRCNVIFYGHRFIELPEMPEEYRQIFKCFLHFLIVKCFLHRIKSGITRRFPIKNKGSGNRLIYLLQVHSMTIFFVFLFFWHQWESNPWYFDKKSGSDPLVLSVANWLDVVLYVNTWGWWGWTHTEWIIYIFKKVSVKQDSTQFQQIFSKVSINFR